MPTVTHHPNGIGSDNAWGSFGVGTKDVLVATNDGDTSGISTSSAAGVKQSFTMPTLPADAAGISSVVEHNLCAEVGAPSNGLMQLMKNGDHNALGGAFTPNNDPAVGVYTDHTLSWDANLTVAGVNAGVSGCYGIVSVAGPQLRSTELYRVVDYSAGTGGFAFLISSVILPLLGAGLSLADFKQIFAFLRTLPPHHARHTEEEILEGIRYYRAWGHRRYLLPSYSLLGAR